MRQHFDRYFIVGFCGVMLAINAISSDILLTGFFAIQADLNTSIYHVQALIPVYMMVAAVGQLVFGPASDRFGRQPVLAVGLSIYLAGSALAIFANSIEVLLFARGLQGFGASCAVVVARAILRDTHSGTELARAMALAMAIFAIGPLLSPMIGVGLMWLGGWRVVFVGLCFVGIGLLAATLLLYRETNMRPDPNALALANLREAALRVLKHPQSRHFMAVSVLLQAVIICFIINMPRLYKSAFNIEGAAFAALFALGALGIVVGQLSSNRLIARIGVLPTLRGAATMLGVTALLMWLASRTEEPSLVLFTILFFLFNLTFLVVMTNSASLVIDPHRDIAGMASAMLGSMTQIVGNVAGLLLMPVIDGHIGTWSGVQLILVAAMLTLALAFRPQFEVSPSKAS